MAFRVPAAACAALAALTIIRVRLRKQSLALQAHAERQALLLRERVARLLHDDLGSRLSQLTVLLRSGTHNPSQTLDAESRIHRAARVLAETDRTFRNTLWTLDPMDESVEALAVRLGRIAQDILEPAGVNLELDIPLELPEHHLGMAQRQALSLVLREALTNVVKYAAANRVRIHLHATRRELRLEIEDDGVGPAPSRTRAPGDEGGHGLPNMHHRMAELGGTLHHGPGRTEHGFRVEAVLPLPTSSRSP